MHIGILETGRLPSALAAAHGSFPDMFEAALRAERPDATFTRVAVVDGALPKDPRDADGWLVTGSRHGVRDELPWMAPLMAFLRAAVAAGVPVVGVCFGHQILAEALGGRVEAAPQGWGLGVHPYTTTSQAPAWMGLGASFASHAVHRDQVVRAPDGATVLAASDHCPNAVLAYGDPARPDAIGVQSHPEFDAAFMAALVADRVAAGVIAPEVAAQATLDAPVDNRTWHQIWARMFAGDRDAVP